MARTVSDGLNRRDQKLVTRGRGKAAGSAVMGVRKSMKAPGPYKAAAPKPKTTTKSQTGIQAALKPKKSQVNKSAPYR